MMSHREGADGGEKLVALGVKPLDVEPGTRSKTLITKTSCGGKATDCFWPGNSAAGPVF